MKKEQQPLKEEDQKNIKPVEEQTEKDKIELDQKSEKSQKKDAETKQKELELKSKKFNKPIELLEFDAVSHFKENIENTDQNCLGPITEKSYYCLSCKHSECPLYNENKNQKEHLLIRRAKCFLYDKHFFDTVENNINESLTYNKLKEGMKECVNNSINSLKDELDKIKEKKMQEIDTFFEETDKYLLELKNKCLNAKQSIEDYYKTNKRFFNITISKDINDENVNNNEIKEKNLAKSELTNVPKRINVVDIETDATNRDIENTVFLLNFELMNLCETKNLEVSDMLKNLKARIESYHTIIDNELKKNMDIVSQFFNFEFKAEKIDDYYWDVVIRTKKYSEMIQQFRETINEIVKGTRSLEKIKDLIDIFDSKLKKNNKIIFQQKYFQENNNDVNNKEVKGSNSPRNERIIRKRNPSLPHTRSNSKSKLYSSRGKSAGKLKKGELNKNNIGSLTLSNDLGLMRLQTNKNEIQDTGAGSRLNTQGNLENRKVAISPLIQKLIDHKNVSIDDIILDQRIIERFFAYSISELFSKNFAFLDPEDETNYIMANKDNIYLTKDPNKNLNIKINNIKSSTNTNNTNNTNITNPKSARSNNNMKKYKSMNFNPKGNNRFNNMENIKNNNILNNLKNSLGFNNSIYNNISMSNNLGNKDPEKLDINQYNAKSVSYLANYTNRYNTLKERAKPIVGTNQIQLFSPNNQKLVRKTTSLNREEHGYSLFPEGCRHILVDDNLYIIGGTNHVRIPINIVLVYNIVSGIIKRLPDLNTTHAYHSVEYLENYNSIICIGGENSSSCEIMNLEDNKWHKLPSLNIPRANCNIYLNNVTGELFVLFGIYGIMSERTNNYSDSIEVLVLNDISQGWLKVDYYKTPGLNLKVNYCMTIPFTRNQLLIYGGSNMRSFRQNIFALFHMIRSECNKVDTQTMELIKLEEKKSRLVDLALTKLG